MATGIADPNNAQLQLQYPIMRTMTKKMSFMTVAMVLTGCVETIVMDPHESELPVVVNCVLEGNIISLKEDSFAPSYPHHFMTNSSKQSLTLQYAKGKSAQDYIPVEDAEVYITCESENSHKKEDTLSFVHVEGCLWEIEKSKRIRPDTEYTLHIEIPGRDHIWAKTKTLPTARVGMGPSIEAEENFNKGMGPSWDEYVRWPFRLDVNGCLDGSSLFVTARELSPDGWKDLEYLVTDHPGVDDFNILGGRFSDVPLLGHPEDTSYLDSIHDIMIEMWYRIDQEFMSDLPLHKGFLRIRNLADGDLFRMSAGPIWYLNVYTNYVSKGDIRTFHNEGGFRYFFHFINSDLDEYLKSIERYFLEIDHNLTMVYGTDPSIYTNIHNGIGIFGSSYTCLSSFIRR